MYVVSPPRHRVFGRAHVDPSAVPGSRSGTTVISRPCSRRQHLAAFATDGHRAKESLTNSSSNSSSGQQSPQTAAAPTVSSGSTAQLHAAASDRPSSGSSSSQAPSSRDWDFWCEHFEQQDLAGSRQDSLQPLLAAAVADEDYTSAAVIRSEINDLIAADAVAAVQQQLAAAVAAERYDLAAVLRDQAWAVLQGWWVCANPGDEGHLLRVLPEYGRWTGQKYTPTDLVQMQAERKRQRSSSSSSRPQAFTDHENTRNLGTPVLEVFVKQQQQVDGDTPAAAAAAAASWISQAVQLRSTFDIDVAAVPSSSAGGDVGIDEAMKRLFRSGTSNSVPWGGSPLADDTAAAAAAGLAAPGSPRTSDMYAAGASVGASFDDDSSSQAESSHQDDSAKDDVMLSGDYSSEVPDSTPSSDQVRHHVLTNDEWQRHMRDGDCFTFDDEFFAAAESTLAAAAAAADAAGGVLCADGETRPISRPSAAAAAARDCDYTPATVAAAAAAPKLQLVVHVIEDQSCVTLGARAVNGVTVSARSIETSEILPPGPRMVPDWSLVVPEQIPGLRARLAASLEAQRIVREMLGGKDGWWKTQLIGTVAPTVAAAAAGDQQQQQQQQQQPREQGQQHSSMTWLLPLQLAHLQQQQRQDWQQQQQHDVTSDPVQSAAVSAADMSGFYPEFYYDFAPDHEGLPWQELLSLIYKQHQQQQQQEEEEAVSASSSSSSTQHQSHSNLQYANLSPHEWEEIQQTLEQLKLGSAAAGSEQQQQQQQIAPVAEQQQQQPRGLKRKRPRLGNNTSSSSSNLLPAEAAWESAVAAAMVRTTSSSSSSDSGFDMMFGCDLERSPATVTMCGKDLFLIGPERAPHSSSSMADQQQQSDTAGSSSSSSKLQDRVFIVEVPFTISDSDQLQQQQQQQQQQQSGAAGSSQGCSRVWQLAAHQVMLQHACSTRHQQPSSSSSSSRGGGESSSSSCNGGLPITWRQPLADLMSGRAHRVMGDIMGTLKQTSDDPGSSSSSSSSDVGTATSSSSSSSQVLSISDAAPILVVEIPPELVHQTVAPKHAAAVETPAAAAAAAAANAPSSSSSSDQWGGRLPAVGDGVVYRRINSGDTRQSDPLTGLFLGAFGPHGPEVIQVQRSVCLDTGAEQVVGVKLTGDDNVPAGELTFRAKVGHRHKMSTRGMFAPQLNITARYPGEGRAADPGFKNPRWVPGELLVFNNSSSRSDESFESWIADAQLGFVFDMPKQRRFCVLLNRVTLP